MPSSNSLRTPSRRMTLGPVNQVDNRRVAFDAGEALPSAKKSLRPPTGRVSMIPRVGRENSIPASPGGYLAASSAVAASRRRSIGVPTLENRRQSVGPPSIPPPASKPDPRPINDKVYQQQCIKLLLSFLIDSGYDLPVSHKSLSRPSAKDFNSICTFMLRLVDPNFQKGSPLMKFEDEVSLNFKCLGYPFTVSKTALVAAGSPHTWPTLLAALTWLMEHIQCHKAGRQHEKASLEDTSPAKSLEELEARRDKVFFDYLGNAYMAFMAGDSKLTEVLETGLADRFERDDLFLENEVERITDLNANMVEQLHSLGQGDRELPSYLKKRETYATDLEQFHDLIRQIDEHKAALQKKVKELTTNVAATNDKLEKMNASVEDLKEMIAKQELSPNDVLKMESELKGLAEAMDRTYAIRDQRNKELIATEKELVSALNMLDSIIHEYNTRVSHLQLVPEIGTKFANAKVSLSREKILGSTEDATPMLGVNLSDSVQPLVQLTKTDVATRLGTETAYFQDSLDALERGHEQCNEATAKLQILYDKKAKCEQTILDEQETHQAKMSVRQREVESMENKVSSLRDPVALEEQMAAFERQCAELEALRMEHQEENIAKKKAVQEEIAVACQLMVQHDAYVQQRVAELQQYWDAKQESISAVKVPADMGIQE